MKPAISTATVAEMMKKSKKRTVPSIPNPEKEVKLIGPWSYTPNDDKFKHRAVNGLIHPEGMSLPGIMPSNEDLKLRHLA